MADAQESKDIPPELVSPALRKKLFLPELERLLADPPGFSLKNNFDSFRVRIDAAIETIEKRCRRLAEETLGQVQARRLATATCAAMGIAAVLAGLGLPDWRLPAFFIAAAEMTTVFILAKNYRRLAARKGRPPLKLPAGKPVVVYPICQPESDILYLNPLGYSETEYDRLQKSVLKVFGEVSDKC
jgi:hypothetical protein